MKAQRAVLSVCRTVLARTSILELIVIIVLAAVTPEALGQEQLAKTETASPNSSSSTTNAVSSEKPGTAKGNGSSEIATAQPTSTEPAVPKVPSRAGGDDPSSSTELAQTKTDPGDSTANPVPGGSVTTESLTSEPDTSGSYPFYFNAQSFQTDLFTGAATAEIPIAVSPGTAASHPKFCCGTTAARLTTSRWKSMARKSRGSGPDWAGRSIPADTSFERARAPKR